MIHQNHPQPVSPTAGCHASTYISVVKGRNRMPRNGTRKPPWKARVTRGVNSQVNSSARRGNDAATSANRQPHARGIVALQFSAATAKVPVSSSTRCYMRFPALVSLQRRCRALELEEGDVPSKCDEQGDVGQISCSWREVHARHRCRRLALLHKTHHPPVAGVRPFPEALPPMGGMPAKLASIAQVERTGRRPVMSDK